MRLPVTQVRQVRQVEKRNTLRPGSVKAATHEQY
jgi:hypothetical protein